MENMEVSFGERAYRVGAGGALAKGERHLFGLRIYP